MKKKLLERAMAYKNLLDNFRYCRKKKLKNSNIKTSERLKNIKESDDSLLRNY